MKFCLIFAGALAAAISLAALPARDPGAGPKSVDRQVDKMFKQLDRNHDGFLSRAEFDGKNAVRFDRLDKDRDGKIEKSELFEWLAMKASRASWAGKGLRRGRGKSALKTWAKI